MGRSDDAHMNQRVLICLNVDVVFPVFEQLLVATERFPLVTVEVNSLRMYTFPSDDLVWILLQALQVVIKVDAFMRRVLWFIPPFFNTWSMR